MLKIDIAFRGIDFPSISPLRTNICVRLRRCYLRIAKPIGAKQRGRLAQSKDMRRRLAELSGKSKTARWRRCSVGKQVRSRISRNGSVDNELVRLLPQGGRLRGTNRGKFSEHACENGKIRFNGKYYNSLTLAAVAAIHRPTNGWWFWQVERGRSNWVRSKQGAKGRNANLHEVIGRLTRILTRPGSWSGLMEKIQMTTSNHHHHGYELVLTTRATLLSSRLFNTCMTVMFS